MRATAPESGNATPTRTSVEPPLSSDDATLPESRLHADTTVAAKARTSVVRVAAEIRSRGKAVVEHRAPFPASRFAADLYARAGRLVERDLRAAPCARCRRSSPGAGRLIS